MRQKLCLKQSVILICLFLLACASPPVEEKEPLSHYLIQYLTLVNLTRETCPLGKWYSA